VQHGKGVDDLAEGLVGPRQQFHQARGGVHRVVEARK